jgi:hypothetical protein
MMWRWTFKKVVFWAQPSIFYKLFTKKQLQRAYVWQQSSRTHARAGHQFPPRPTSTPQHRARVHINMICVAADDQKKGESAKVRTTAAATMFTKALILCLVVATASGKLLEPKPFKRLIPADTLRGEIERSRNHLDDRSWAAKNYVSGRQVIRIAKFWFSHIKFPDQNWFYLADTGAWQQKLLIPNKNFR